MGQQDRIMYHALRFVQARAVDDHVVYDEALAELREEKAHGNLDALDVIDGLAILLAAFYRQSPNWEARLQSNIVGLRATKDIDDDDPGWSSTSA